MANCLAKALEAFPEADREDMKKVFDRLNSIRQRTFLEASANPDAAFRAQAKELLDGYRKGVKIAEAKTIANISKETKNQAFIKNPVFRSIADGIQAILTGTSQMLDGGRASIAQMFRAHSNEMFASFLNDLKQMPGALEAYRSGALDEKILIEQAELANGRKGGVTGDKMALHIAEARQNLQRLQLMKMNDAGAAVNDLQGRLMQRVYDQSKLLKVSEDEFVKDMLGWVNAEKSFKRPFEDLNGEDVLRDIYRKVTRNRDVMMDLDGEDSKAVLRRVQSPANLARVMERGRTIHIDAPTDEFAFMKKYGSDSLSEDSVRSITKTARRVAMIERLGTNPELAYAALKEGVSNPGELSMLDRHWKNIDGSATAPGSGALAKAGRNFRLIQDMQSLFTTAVAHFPNLITGAALHSVEGASFWDGLAKSLEFRVKNLSSAARDELLYLHGVGADSHIGEFHNQFSSTEGGKMSFLSKMHEKYMSLTGIRPMADIQDAANGQMLAARMGYHAEKSFAQLDPQYARVLQKYNIGPQEWDLIRNTVQLSEDGRKYASLEDIRNVPFDKAKEILAKGGINFEGLSDAKVKPVVEKFQRQTATNLANYFNDRSAIATGKAGAFERAAFSNRGFSEDTVEGQLFRSMSQYKNYGFTMSSQFVPMLYREGIQGQGAKGAVLAAQVLTGMTALGYLSYAAKQMMLGRSAPSPLDENGEFHGEIATKIAEHAMLHSGALGIFNSFLLDDFDSRHGKNFLSYVGGPAASKLSDAMNLWTDLRSTADRSEPDKLKASAVSRFAMNTILGNAAGLRQGLDYLWLNNLAETLNPGYSARMRKRLQEQGQHPIAPWAAGYQQE